MTCPACGGAVPEGARFCPSCGRPMALVGGADERKLATVLFADLAGSTELAMRMDAEQLRSLLADVYYELSQAAEAFGGTVEKFIGDAVMAVFGVPQAHEDDPERAVRAALTMRSRMSTVSRRHGVDSVLRIGIHTGVVVAGTTPGRDFLVTGEVVNLAARLQQAAEPGEILIGETTFRALQQVVQTTRPRSLLVKGRTGPVLAYAVESVAPATAYRRRRQPGPFVGRAGEVALLSSLISRAVEHHRAHLVTVIGEPGIGKSRLAEEVVIELQHEPDPPAVWVGRCLPYGERGPYAPLSEVLLRAANVSVGATREEARLAVTAQLLALLGEQGAETIEDVLRTAGLAESRESLDEDVEGPGRGRDAWRTVLSAFAARGPVLLVLEDAHWAEAALLDLIESLATDDARAPLVMLCLARDDLLRARAGWGSGLRNSTLVTLEAIGDVEMRRLADSLAGSGDERIANAVELAGGNPFFLEEIVAMASEGGRSVPPTVQGVIAARLDLLPPEEKRLMQRAAVIGRTFGEEELEIVSPDSAKRLVANLSRRDLLLPLGSGWGFKHVLIRDVAYDSIPRADRARTHLELARRLEGTRDEDAQTVAGHYASAVSLGASEARGDAVRMLLRAASEARDVYAHGLALRQASLAHSLAVEESDRSMGAEAVGDAHWMAEHLDEAFTSYGEALEHGHAAKLPPADMARLSWKWVDLPTRWGWDVPTQPTREALEAEIEEGLANATAAGARSIEARLLIARALVIWRFEFEPEPQEVALPIANRALEIGEELGKPLVVSAALDARSALLQALRRYRDARAADERRLELLPEISSREEQMDICAAVARTRTSMGEYAAAVAAADLADQLVAGGDQRWAAWPARTRVEAYFYWDRWDDALRAHDRYMKVFRSTYRTRRVNVTGVVSGIAAAIHLLRGEREQADLIEQRLGRQVPANYNLVVGHAMLGCGEPSLALDSVAKVRFWRPWVLAVTAEAQAALGRWDDLDNTLAQVDAMSGVDGLPRVAAQIDRARGIAGDEIALARAEEAFRKLGCRFEQARCLELMGQTDKARRTYERLGAEPAMSETR
jgi:class 3 adenylate cyclase/tetratricopeptide (TPR) repeat protein